MGRQSLAVVAAGVVGCAGGVAPQDLPRDGAAPVAPAPVVTPFDPAKGPVTAFVDVTTATMETPVLASHQTVLVQGDMILALGPTARIVVPPGATTVDGRGRFLIPGLADMHVHLDGTRGMLELFVANGVTTVRNMSGSARILALRDRVRRGELLGPTIITAGPFIDGARPKWAASDVVAKPADAEAVVAAQAAAGYDFIKVYNGLTVESYDAVAAAAKAHGLRFAGHIPIAVSLTHALELGQASIEHFTGYAVALERPDSPVRRKKDDVAIVRRWLYADDAKVGPLAELTAHHSAWNCPTLVTSIVYADLRTGHIPVASDLDLVSPDWRARWDPAHSPRKPKPALRTAVAQARARTLLIQQALVRELVASGAPLLAGTDTPNPYVVPGSSLHQELALFVGAGLTPYTALRAATIDAADFLGDPRAGRIAVGAHADLVLLDSDPLADIHALDKNDGVMVHGTWMSPEKLLAMHDTLAAGYRAPAWEQKIDLSDVPELAKSRVLHYVLRDNGAPVGAYAVARVGGAMVERQTLEDETITVRTAFAGKRTKTVTIDIDRPEAKTHVEHPAGRDGWLVAWLTPAIARGLVEAYPLEVDDKKVLAVTEPDPDNPETLAKGSLTIHRVEGDTETQKAFRLRLTIEHGTWVGRLVMEGDGLPSLLRLSSTSRALVRTWRRR